MKKLLLVSVVLMAVGVCGCDATSKQRIEWLQQSLDTATKASARFDSDMQLMEDTVADLKAAAKDPGLQQADAERIAGYLTAATEKMVTVTNAKAKADEVIAATQAAISKIDTDQANIGTELQAVGDVMQGVGSSVPPPYGTLITIGGLLVGAIGTGIAKRKGDALKVSDAAARRKDNALVGVVKSIDVARKTLDEDGPIEKAFVRAMKDSQKETVGVRAEVRKIRS